jgi:hypothetical protein
MGDENISVWKNKTTKERYFRQKMGQEESPPKKILIIEEEKLIFPPLQTVYDRLPYENSEPKKDENERPPMVEGMTSRRRRKKKTATTTATTSDSIKASTIVLSDTIKNGKTFIYDSIYEGSYWFVKEDIQLLNKTHQEKQSDENIKKDARYLQTFVTAVLILPLCLYATYNWYYLLFFQESLAVPMDLENSFIVSNPIVNFFLEFVLAPVKLMDFLLFKWIPEFDTDKTFNPFQSVNFILMFIFIGLFFMNYIENKVANIGVMSLILVYSMAICYALSIDNKYLLAGMLLFIGPILTILSLFGKIFGELFESVNFEAIIYVVVILAWAKWSFEYLFSMFSSPTIPPNLVMLVLNGLFILIRLMISIMLVPFSMFLFNMYLLFNSFFGIARFEEKWFSALQGIMPFIQREDKNFFDKHNLSFLQYFFDFFYGRFIWLGYILLFLFFIIQFPFTLSSFNLKSTMMTLLCSLLVIFISVLYVFQRKPIMQSPPLVVSST